MKRDTAPYGQSIVTEILSEKLILSFRYEALYGTCCLINKLYHITDKKEWRKCELKKKKSEMYRNEIKSYIVRAGMTMSEVVDYLSTPI